MIENNLHSCPKPSTFFMRGVKFEEWQCNDCGRIWQWAKTGFSGDADYGWHLVIGREGSKWAM